MFYITNKMKTNTITINKHAFGIGWISGIRFIEIETQKPIKLRSYNGCLCFILNKKRIGYGAWKKSAVTENINITNECPF